MPTFNDDSKDRITGKIPIVKKNSVVIKRIVKKNMASTTSTNYELQLANDFVQNTGCNIFLTGKAGTGKTTFLHSLQKNMAKRMIITAPTGVAAINAGGVTLHSFFQLPFGPFVPGSETYERNKHRQFRFSKEKRRIIQSLDLLVIDEISMVRADLLDAVDAALRRHRRNNQPFGGMQLLMIGDLHQLSPVAKHDDWQLIKQYYESVYFFSSKALALTELLTIELKHIYRQSDAGFIKLLNRVRDNRLDESTLADLNQRYLSNFTPGKDQGYITLTTHNRNADSINQAKLQSLDKKEHHFKAQISGDFPEHIYPTSATLRLKEGAQVMFVRNDPSVEKLYYNGKIGRVIKISNETISVICPGDSEKIVVEPIIWENIKYTLNDENKEIQEDIIGKFTQYPLKLAWAITIHKSQGLTFDKAIIDARAAFAHGQVYVALSRCKTIEGMVLSSPLSSKGIETNPAVTHFIETASQNPPSKTLFQTATINYQQQLLLDCFDFQLLRNRLNYLCRLLLGNARVVQVSGITDIRQLEEMALKNIFVISENFKRQLNTIFGDGNLPESDAVILERISKASVWFQDQSGVILGEPVQKLHVETDNTELRKKINNALNNLKKEIAVKSAGVQSCEKGFSPSAFLHAVANAEIDFIPEKRKKNRLPDYGESDIEHLELFQTLKDWRSNKAKEKELALFQILHQRVLIQIVVCLPENTAALKRISGVGKKTIKNYGEELMELVLAYRKKYGIDKVALPEPKNLPKESTPAKKKAPSSDTKQTSFDMFNKGLTIAKIAEERGLVQNTIEGHLAFFVEKGTLDINRLLSPEKQQAIKKELAIDHNNSLSEVKNTLGDEYSYGEVKMIISLLKHLAS
ncbi:helix-turn-helix domain-containing protein [Desulfobacula sp.]|uniref:helix-turn-helix domain-containing protein n=1 Tax=Desulfobacula sp. TaxID=2593537 RepID=UPI0025C4E894|nr:helix-turn-helix domain-containing protein [Desulfobacula sp.]